MLQPFIVSGIAVGALYALSGVGMVVLYRATGVLNLAYGALGALGALTAWELSFRGMNEWLSYAICIALAAGLSLAYGAIVGAYLADREPAVKAIATLGLALIVLGGCLWFWSDKPRTLTLPTGSSGFDVGDVRVTATQVAALALAVAITGLTALYLRRSRTGTEMRALANDRELSAMLGVRVRRVEALAWLVSGALAGLSGLFLADLTRLEASSLTFLVIPALAAGVVGRFRSLLGTLAGGIVVGLAEALPTPYDSITQYRSAAPFLVAILMIVWLQRHRTVTIEAAGR